MGKSWDIISKNASALSREMKITPIFPIVVLSLAPVAPAAAQLIPDKTLGPESSVVTPVGQTGDRIDGGAARGSNLFHSFQEFNVDAGRRVDFANPTGIENIMTRVTGSNPSNILGTLGVLGEANLFLVNPNGIIFGPSASLDIRGSFFATTADGIKLGATDVFDATNPDGSRLLTVKPEALFDNAMAAYMAKISNQGTLAVGTGSTLGLHGGEVNVTGILSAPGGRVEVLGDKVTVASRATINVSSQGANGGLVEVSGNSLSFAGKVDTRGANGTGTLLLDPKNIEISTSGTMSGETISANLNATNVVLQADNDITVDDDITGTGGNSLTLQAGRSIVIEENRTISLGGGDLIAYINDENAMASARDPGTAQMNVKFASEILTDGGNVTVEPGSLGGVAIGEVIVNGATINAGGGNIALTGRGGDGGDDRHGIYIHNGGRVQTSGTGSINLTGRGGDGGNRNRGIYMIEDARISSEDGDINALGTGGNGTGFENQGIQFRSRAVVEALGTGKVTMTGRGGRGTRFQDGIVFGGGNTATAVEGDISLTGIGGNGTRQRHSGILLGNGTRISTTGRGSITLTGTGGDGRNENFGMTIRRSEISTNLGEINLNGTGGDGEADAHHGIEIDNRSGVTAGGNLTVVGTSRGTQGDNKGIWVRRNSSLETHGEMVLTGSGTAAGADIDLANMTIGQHQTGAGLTLQGNKLNIVNAQISSGGNMQLQQRDPTADLFVELENSQFGGRETSSSQITIGSENSSGAIAIAGSALFNDPVSILSPVGAGSIDTQNANLAAGDKGTFSLRANSNITAGNFYAPQGINFTSIQGEVDTSSSIIFDQNTVVETRLVPDSSLGTESSTVVAIDGKNDRVTGGAVRGSNLLHSFSEFNVGNDRGVDFANPEGISNILTRVTGDQPSEIWGRIGVEGEANLFLLNPRGILFAPTARLDVNGSFVASSANAIVLDNGEIFGKNSPLPTQDRVPQGLRFSDSSSSGGKIINQGNLLVPSGESLLLVGGDIQLGGAFLDLFSLGNSLEAPGGRIELGGIAAAGEIGLDVSPRELKLDFPEAIARANVFVTGGARVNVASGGGGAIAISGKDVEVVGSDIGGNVSIVRGGIEEELGSKDAVAGDITINATGRVSVTGWGTIANNMRHRGTAGNINISGAQLLLDREDAPFRNAIENRVPAEGRGDAGDINIQVGSLSINRVEINGRNNGVGNSASVEIEVADSFDFNGSIVSTIVTGEGNAGAIAVKAGEIVGGDRGPVFDASNRGRGNSGLILIETDRINLEDLFVRSVLTGEGESSSINIRGRSISLGVRDPGDDDNSVVFNSETFSSGKGSDINITAENLNLQNIALQTVTSGPQASGDGGNINIVADVVRLGSPNPRLGGGDAVINAGTVDRSSGDGGNINIQARELYLEDGVNLTTGVQRDATGRGGTINIEVTEILEIAGSPASGIRADVESEGRGDGGDINIAAGQLLLGDGSLIQASTQGKGKAGTITVNAGVVDIAGSDSRGLPSGLFTSTDSEFDAGDITVNSNVFQIAEGAVLSARSRGDGRGGTIAVNTHQFSASSGGQLVTTTFGNGVAGNIEVNASGEVSLSGSDPTYSQRIADFGELDNADIVNDINETGAATGLYASSTQDSTQGGGTIALRAGSLRVGDGARITADSDGTGSGGNISINADKLQLEDGSNINTDTASGLGGGNITLTAQDLRVRDNSKIETNAGGRGDGGDITINTDTLLVLEESAITANAIEGRGGNIAITTSGLFSSPDSFITASSEFGVSGIVTVNNPDSNPTAGLVSLPKNPIDPNQQIVTGCSATAANGSFIVTGRGGLAEDPTSIIRGTTLWRDLANYTEETSPSPGRSRREGKEEFPAVTERSRSEERPIVQATGWVRHPDGTVELVAFIGGASSSKGIDCSQL